MLRQVWEEQGQHIIQNHINLKGTVPDAQTQPLTFVAS